MRRQRVTGDPNDQSIKQPKISKLSQPMLSQSQNDPTFDLTQSWQTPSASQLLPRRQAKPPVFDVSQFVTQSHNLDQLTKIWNLAKENKIIVTKDQDQIRITESKNDLASAHLKIERLQKRICEQKERHKTLAKAIEAKCKIQDKILEKHHCVTKLWSEAQEHIQAISKRLDECNKSLEYSTDLFDDVALTQQKLIEHSKEQLKNNVSEGNKILEAELELKTNEFLLLQTKCGETESQMNENKLLANKIDSELEESKLIIDKNNEQQTQVTAKMLETIEETKKNCEADHERILKLLAENYESSTSYDEHMLKYKALKTQDSEYLSQIEKLKSSELELQKQEEKLDNEFDELQNTHLAITLNEELQAEEERIKEIQTLTSVSNKAADELTRALSTKDELSKIVAATDENKTKLEKMAENKDDEISKIWTKLNDVLAKSKKSTENIEARNVELIAIEETIGENRENIQNYEAKKDRNIHIETDLRAELHETEQQLSVKCEVMVNRIKTESDNRMEFSKQIQKLKEDIRTKNNSISKMKKNTEDLQRKTERSRSELRKKIQYQNASHEKRIKDQNRKIELLEKELEAVKFKQNQSNTKKIKVQKEKEEHGNELKELKLTFDNLKNKLAAAKQEHQDLATKVTDAEASIETNSAAQEKPAANATPKPILKSVTKNIQVKSQKVQFDLGHRRAVEKSKKLEIFNDAERRSIASKPQPDWFKIGGVRLTKTSEADSSSISMTDRAADHHFSAVSRSNKSQWTKVQVSKDAQAEETSSVVAETQASQSTQPTQVSQQISSQPRKFFKLPREKPKSTYMFGRK